MSMRTAPKCPLNSAQAGNIIRMDWHSKPRKILTLYSAVHVSSGITGRPSCLVPEAQTTFVLSQEYLNRCRNAPVGLDSSG